MKRVFLLLTFVGLLFWSCEEEEAAADCIDLATTYTTASDAFVADQSVANCDAMMNAWLAQYDADCFTDVDYTDDQIASFRDGSYCENTHGGGDGDGESHIGMWYATSIGAFANTDCAGDFMVFDSTDCAQRNVTWELREDGVMADNHGPSCHNIDDGDQFSDSASCVAAGGQWDNGILGTYTYESGNLTIDFNDNVGAQTGTGTISNGILTINALSAGDCYCSGNDEGGSGEECDEDAIDAWDPTTDDSTSCQSISGAGYDPPMCYLITFDQDSVLTDPNCEDDDDGDDEENCYWLENFWDTLEENSNDEGPYDLEACQAIVDAAQNLLESADDEDCDTTGTNVMFFADTLDCEDWFDDGIMDTPEVYEFESRFDDESSVYYNGQVVRNLLMNDIKTQAGTDASSGDATTLLSMMANDDATREILTSAGDMSTVQTYYHDISTSHLNDRLEAVSDYTANGFGQNAGTLISGWVTELVDGGLTNSSGHRLDQMIQKTLWGAVAYWQGTSKYMSKIPTDDNTVADDGDNWTAMEHHWDESFGYFGAARDYNTGYTDDADRKSDPYHDTNGDGSIDLGSEYNIGWAVTAAKRDLCNDCDTDYDFTKTIFDAYLEGRTLIHNQGDLASILVQRDIILENWEKVAAAVTIHYINDVAEDMAALYQADPTAGPLSESSADLNNHWAEMRAYAMSLMYNDFKVITDAQLETLYTTMGTAPVYPEAGSEAFYTYHGLLLSTAKSVLQEAYGFSDANMDNW